LCSILPSTRKRRTKEKLKRRTMVIAIDSDDDDDDLGKYNHHPTKSFFSTNDDGDDDDDEKHRKFATEQDGIILHRSKDVRHGNEEDDDDDDGGKIAPPDDPYEEGTWGKVSRQDILCVMATMVLVVSGIVIAFIFLLNPNNSTNKNANTTVTTASNGTPFDRNPGNNGMTNNSNGNNAHTVATNNNNDPLYETAAQQYDAIRRSIQELTPESTGTIILSNLPDRIDDLQAAPEQKGDAYEQAVRWILFPTGDTVTTTTTTTPWHHSALIPRFVMAVTYLANGGATTWKNRDHWMTNDPICTWYGIRCRVSGHIDEVKEVDLSNNGLNGPIHDAWTLLSNCSSILLDSNSLTGTIPGEVFGNMPSLEYLYLKNNQLSGTVPVTLKTGGKLGTYILTSITSWSMPSHLIIS
jgi:Leucine rich repeat